MPISTDPALLDVACDVTIRFWGHDSYGNEAGAIRAPGHTPEEYEAVFAFLCDIYDRAEAAIPRHPAHRPEKTTNLAEVKGIDFDACMRDLDEIEPGRAAREKSQILNWCIFWHYLK
jgi:hypothetical protein